MLKKILFLRVAVLFCIFLLLMLAFHPAINPIFKNSDKTIFANLTNSASASDAVLESEYGYSIIRDINVMELINATPVEQQIDADNDGLYDSVEIVIGTDINNNDSDFDQLDDFYEITNNLDPLNPDSNYDGLADYNEMYNITEDIDNDNLTNPWDEDNDNDGVTDSKDLSPFSKSKFSDSFNFEIKTNGNPSFLDFQIRPKEKDHLTLPLQYWDWPEDNQGLMKDLNNSEEDVFILPYLEMEFITDFKIISIHSGKCMEVNNASISENATIRQNSYSGKLNQHWSILPVSEGYVKIVATHSKKCLAVDQSSLDEGAPIVQQTFTGSDNQLWKLEIQNDDTYNIISKNSGKYIEVFNASLKNNAPINQTSFTKESHQIWILKDVNDVIPDQSEVADYGTTIDLNKTLIPLTPIWDNGLIPAFNGRMYFPISDPLKISTKTKLVWKVYGKSDTKLISLEADNGKMVSANNSKLKIGANSSDTGNWETFEWITLGPDRIALKANNGKYIGLVTDYLNLSFKLPGHDPIVFKTPIETLEANSNEIGDNETFEVVPFSQNKIALKADNELYVSKNDGYFFDCQNPLTAIASTIGGAETFIVTNLGFNSDTIPLVTYYEDFMITGFNIQENYGSSIACFYNQEINETIKAGFVVAYDFLRSQNDLSEIPDMIQNRNITINYTIKDNSSHQDESIYLLMSEMLPQIFYNLTNQTNDTALPLIIAMQDQFTTKTLDDITSSLLLEDYRININTTECPVVTSKVFKMNWYDLDNLSVLNTDQVLLESMRWGLNKGFEEDNETLVTMMSLFHIWNSGEFKITHVGEEEIIFDISESPEVLNILQYSVFSISSIIDIATLITKSSKVVTYRFLVFSAKLIKMLLKPLAKAIQAGIKILRLNKIALKTLNVLKNTVKAIKSSKAAKCVVKIFKSTRFLSFLDKLGTLLILIDLAITGVIAFYMFWSILFEQGFSDFGAALGAWVVIFSFAYAGLYILLAIALPVIGIILAILDMIFDFFGDLLEWFLDLVTKTEVRSNFNLGFVGNPKLETHDYDNNGLDVGDRIEFLAQVFGHVWKTSDGNWGDVRDSYVKPYILFSVPEGSSTGGFRNKIKTQTDGYSYRNETYDVGVWVDPINMNNYPLTIQLKYEYKRYYDECVWFFGWWCDRESNSGTEITDITTLYFDVFPGNLTSFLYWNELTPLDSDGDGLNDEDEFKHASNPWRVDTDGDGLWDKYETDFGSIPYKPDSDDDGLNDKLENRLGSANNNTDSDDDGLNDYEEYRGWMVEFEYYGTPFSMIVSPDLLNNDTDQDSLTDLEEYMKGLNPRSNDTDADGILDPDELKTPYQGIISNIELNRLGSSIRVTPNSTINADVNFRIFGTKCPLINDSSNCSIVLTIENNTGTSFLNHILFEGKPKLDNLTENVTTFSFNASSIEGIYLIKYFIDWECIGIVPATDKREIIGIIDVNESYSGSIKWQCYDITSGDNDKDYISNLNENIGWQVNYTDDTGCHVIHVTSDPGLIDTDLDGEWDLWEHNCFENSTNPRNPDTDGDGLNDWDEKYRYKTNPLNFDTDADGLDDQTELIFKSDPLMVDTDFDGLNDKHEFDLKSNPNNADTDSDGLTDLEEYLFNSSLVLPDTDYDTLFDKMEFNLLTDPQDPDTDDDGLIDGYELVVNTDPKKADTDNDTLNDYLELYWGTDPLDVDTDNDSLIDGYEINYPSHPLIKDTDRDGINDFEDYDTYVPNVESIVLAFDLDEDVLEFEEHLKQYTNVTNVSIDDLLNDPNYKKAPYIVLVGNLDSGDGTVGNLSKNILEGKGENTTEIIQSGYPFFASKNGIWNETQTIVMLSQPYRLDHIIVLNLLKTMWKKVNGSSIDFIWPTPRDSLNIEAVNEIGMMMWVDLEKPVNPSISLVRYNNSNTPKTLDHGKGLKLVEETAGIYLEINPGENIQNESIEIIKEAWILVYYTASDLDRNGDGDANDFGDIDEGKLAFYVFDSNSGKWIKLSTDLDWVIETGIDTNNVEIYGKVYEGYIWAKISHFSLYSIAGRLIKQNDDGPRPVSTNTPPKADASASERYGFINTPITLDASNSRDDGKIESYLWDFGDGNLGEGRVTSHQYQRTGTYQLTLTVIDNYREIDTDKITVTISQANNPPTKPTITGPVNGTITKEYIFTAKSNDTDPEDKIRYGWDWDNDDQIDHYTNYYSSEELVMVYYSFPKAGFYQIKVRAEDKYGSVSGWSELHLSFIDIDYRKQADGSYLIDNEVDGKWDISYDPSSDEITKYEGKKEGMNLIIFLIIFLILIILVGVSVYFKNRSRVNQKKVKK